HPSSEVDRNVTISIGVVVCTPSDCEGMEDLIRMADKALYQAKRDGRNRVVFLQ
ncbi:MAG: diguanylate cyclase, partial [Nitrospirae bacterium]|nr:diguanylate cyclase [Nitrospirota bacterium]